MKNVQFDRDTLYAMYDNETDLILDLFNEYLSNYESTVSNLKETFNISIKEFEKALHYHSSAFQYIGFKSLTVDCHELEKKCKNNEMDFIQNDFTSLMNQISQTYSIIQNEVMNIKQNMAV